MTPKPQVVSNAQITKLSHEGRGICKLNGKTSFVFNALENEIVTLRITNSRSKFNEAVAINITQRSPDRVEPLCPHFGVCGGCQLQHLSAEKQITHKQSVLLELLAQQDLKPLNILPPLRAANWAYRHKARLGVSAKNKTILGFREQNSAALADLTECLTLDPSIGKKISLLKQFIATLSGRSDITQIEIAVDDYLAALVVRHLKLISPDDRLRWQQFCREQQFKLYFQANNQTSARLDFGPNSSPLLHYQFDNLDFAFLPQQFTQINPEINKKMVAQAIELLELNSQDQVLDLFCGIGNFSLPLAKSAKSVVGVEGDDSAVSMARFNALHNNLKNCDFVRADLFKSLTDYEFSKQHFSKILLDPPRGGAIELLPQIAQWRPSKLLYISCNPSTLARDAKELAAMGYTLSTAGVMDMFPQTEHVEAMALFQCRTNG